MYLTRFENNEIAAELYFIVSCYGWDGILKYGFLMFFFFIIYIVRFWLSYKYMINYTSLEGEFFVSVSESTGELNLFRIFLVQIKTFSWVLNTQIILNFKRGCKSYFFNTSCNSCTWEIPFQF